MSLLIKGFSSNNDVRDHTLDATHIGSSLDVHIATNTPASTPLLNSKLIIQKSYIIRYEWYTYYKLMAIIIYLVSKDPVIHSI